MDEQGHQEKCREQAAKGCQLRQGNFLREQKGQSNPLFFSYMEISQSYNARPCREQVVSGRFSDILKVRSSHMSREDLDGLASEGCSALGNVSSNLSRNFVATQVARKIA